MQIGLLLLQYGGEATTAPREGAYVHGLYMEGARWDTNLNTIMDSKLKELHPIMPIMYIKAITQVVPIKKKRNLRVLLTVLQINS